MTHSDKLAAIAPALAAFQAEIENVAPNATNPHFKSKYTDLAGILNEVRPLAEKHGLAIVQFPGFADGIVTLETMILHKSGEWIKGESGAPSSKQDPQGVGSAITYLRRYSLAAICALAQEDDDAESAMPARRNGKKQAAPIDAPADEAQSHDGPPATEKQITFIRKLLNSHHISYEERQKVEGKIERGLSKAAAIGLLDRMTTYLKTQDAAEKAEASTPVEA